MKLLTTLAPVVAVVIQEALRRDPAPHSSQIGADVRLYTTKEALGVPVYQVVAETATYKVHVAIKDLGGEDERGNDQSGGSDLQDGEGPHSG